MSDPRPVRMLRRAFTVDGSLFSGQFLGTVRPEARDIRLQAGLSCVSSTIPASHSMVADRRRVSVPMPRRMVRVVSSRGHGQPSMVFPSSTLLGSAGTPPLPLAGVRSAAPELKAQPAGGLLRFKRLPRMAGSGQFAAPGFSRKTSGSVPCEARFKSSDRKSCEAAPRVGLVDANALIRRNVQQHARRFKQYSRFARLWPVASCWESVSRPPPSRLRRLSSASPLCGRACLARFAVACSYRAPAPSSLADPHNEWALFYSFEALAVFHSLAALCRFAARAVAQVPPPHVQLTPGSCKA